MRTTKLPVEYVLSRYNEGYGSSTIAKELSVGAQSVLDLLKKYGVVLRGQRKYFFNEHYFSVIDTHEKAYFLGFIAADGNVFGNRLKLCNKKEDVYILQAFSDAIEHTGKIVEYTAGYPELAVRSKAMVEDLLRHGISPNKSKTLMFPSTISEEFINSFMLGYFDGDGSVGIYFGKRPKDKKGRPVFSVLGTKEFCTSFKQILITNCNATDTMVRDIRNSIHCYAQGSTKVVKNIHKFLYADCPIFLTRKKQIFEEVESRYK